MIEFNNFILMLEVVSVPRFSLMLFWDDEKGATIWDSLIYYLEAFKLILEELVHHSNLNKFALAS